MERPFDVFLSHNSRDKPVVREVWEQLRERGLRPWLDEEELTPGEDWQDEIEKALLAIPVAVVLVGEEGLGAWERPEMRVCLDRAMHGKMRVIPVLLPGAPAEPEIPPFLGTRTWVDFRSGVSPRPLDRLFFGITGSLGEAEPLMRRAAAIWERSFGPDHPTTKLGRRNLENLLAQRERAEHPEEGQDLG